MDKQDHLNCAMNPNYLSPFKESHYVNHTQQKLICQSSSSFRSGANYTPSKRMDLNAIFCQSLGETPINVPFSPSINNPRGDIPNLRPPFQFRGQIFDGYNLFRPISTPNYQRISEKK